MEKCGPSIEHATHLSTPSILGSKSPELLQPRRNKACRTTKHQIAPKEAGHLLRLPAQTHSAERRELSSALLPAFSCLVEFSLGLLEMFVTKMAIDLLNHLD